MAATLIFRGIDGHLEPWEPRLRPEPWTERLSRRKRRRLARSGHRGRRGATRQAATVLRPADPLPRYAVHCKTHSEFPFATFAVFVPVEEVVLEAHHYEQCVRYSCTNHGRGPECDESCVLHRVHTHWVRAVVYCKDPNPFDAEVRLILNKEAKRVASEALEKSSQTCNTPPHIYRNIRQK